MKHSPYSVQRSAVLTLALFLCASILSHAATWYVRTTGSDANAGTSATAAFLTIQKAINTATAGDVIDVGEGTFNESIMIEKSITLNGANAGVSGGGTRGTETIITGYATSGAFGAIRVDGTATVVIDGFTIEKGTTTNLRGILLGNTTMVPGPVTIKNNIITGWTTGISLAGGATSGWVDEVTITNNKFVNNGIGSTENATNLVIQDNVFQNGGLGLGTGATMAAAISGNTFTGATAGRYFAIASGVTLYTGDNLSSIVANNTFDKSVSLSEASGQWYTQAIFANISGAITAAASGATITVSSGIFTENLTVNKRLTIDGAGSGSNAASNTIITAASAGTSTIVYSVGGSDASNRQTLKDVRITGASGGTGNNNSGILISGGSMGYFTFDNITATGNSGHGLVSNVAPATSTLTDVVITGSAFSSNGAIGVRTASHSVSGFTVTNTSFTNNASLGLAFNSSDNTIAQIGGVTLTNVTFSGNSSVADLYAFRMLGSMSLTNVDFLGSNGSGLFGLYLLGGYISESTAPAIGTVTLNDVTVSGTYTSAGISFLGYSTLANVSMTDVVLNTSIPTANRGHLRLSGIAGVLSLGNTAFQTPSSVVPPLDILLNSNFGALGSKSTVRVDATNATFDGKKGSDMTLTELYALEDRIRHGLDLTTDAPGFVRVKSGEVFVTSTSGSIQRGVDAATAGDVVNVQAGTYTATGGQSVARINKTLTLKGANAGKAGSDPTRGAESIITGGTSATSANLYVVDIKANDVVLDGFEITHPNYTVGGDADLSGILVGGYEGGLVQWTGIQIKNNLIHDIGSPSWSMSSGSTRQGINIAPVNGITISDNKIYDISGTNGTYCYGVTAWGDSDPTPSTNVTITNNVIMNITSTGGATDDLARAVALNYKSGAATVSNNTISGVMMGVTTSASAAPAAVVVSGNDITASGAGVWARSPRSLTVENNKITAATDGVRVRTGAGVNGTITVTNNDLSGNTTGVRNSSTAIPSATCNWFGSDNVTTVAGKISGTVTYAPFLTNGTDDDPTIGFQPVSGSCNGGPVQVYANSTSTTPLSGHATIQSAIDAASAGNEIRVYPGSYREKAENRWVFGTNGPHKFGLFIDKSLTIRGVDADGNAITNASSTLATITTNSTANFGPSGIFVQASDVTITGLQIGDNYNDANAVSSNKTIEVVGDNFTLLHCWVNTSTDEGTIYFGEWDATSTAIESYTISNNRISNCLVSINNGVGTSGANANRKIQNNTFDGTMTPYVIGFRGWNGANPAQGWIVYPVGGAIITGNTFSNNAAPTSYDWINARGNNGGYTAADFDWEDIWSLNTFPKKVVALNGTDGIAGFNPRAFNNGTYPATRRISPVIQSNIDVAQTGDIVYVGAGTFAENITISKRITLEGAGSDAATGTILNPKNANTSGNALVGNEVIHLNAGGGSATERIVLRKIRVTGATGTSNGGSGIHASTGFTGYLTMDNVVSTGNASNGFRTNLSSGTNTDIVITNCSFSGNTSSGFGVATGVNINGLTITNSSFDNNTLGLDVQSIADRSFTNINISNSSFSNNGDAGIYVNRLSDAVLDGLTVDNNTWRGIDLAFRATTNSNITIKNSNIRNNGTTGAYLVGLNVRPRTSTGASLSNLTVTNNVITGSPTNVIFTGNVDLSTCSMTNNEVSGGTTYGVNASSTGGEGSPSGTLSATCNWWGSDDAATVAAEINGAVTAIPYLTSTAPTDYTNPGFAPSGTCNGTGPVTSDDPVAAYFNFQSAIDGSNEGATITAIAGTYSGSININKEVTLDGTGTTISGTVTISDEDAVLTNATLSASPALVFASGIGDYTLGTGNTFAATSTTYVKTNGASNNITLPAGTVLGTITLPVATPGHADNYTIEDNINHALDAGGLGLVRWNGNRLYVTSNSGSIQRAIDAATSSDAIYIANATFNENPVLHKDIVLYSASAASRRLGTSNYYVFGTTGLGNSNFSSSNSGDFNKVGVNTNGSVSEAISTVNTSGTVLLTTEVQSGGTSSAEFSPFTFSNKAITIEGNGTTGTSCDVAPVISINGGTGVAVTSEGDLNRTLKNVLMKIDAANGANFVRVTNGSIGDITVDDVHFQRGTEQLYGLQPRITPAALNDGKDIPEFLQDGVDVGYGPGKVLFSHGAPFNAANVVGAWKGNDADANSVQTVYSYSNTTLNLSQTFLTRRPSRSAGNVNNGDFNGNTVIGIPTSGDRLLQALTTNDITAGSAKTLFVVFRTPPAGTTDRVIYKHGDDVNGMNIIYDDDENVQFNIFNSRTATANTFESFDMAVPQNTVAIAQLYFDGSSDDHRVGAAVDYGANTHAEAFANSTAFAASTLNAPAAHNLNAAINVGALLGKTYFEGGSVTTTTPANTLRGGFIAEIIVLNTAAADVRNDVYCYLHEKYALGTNGNGLERAIPIYDEEEEIMAGASNIVWPNPATDRASVAFMVPESQDVTLTLVDALGRPVSTIASNYMMAGENVVDVALDGVPSGLYTIVINGFTFTTSAPVMVKK